jgi:hypothetical protein
VAQDLALDFELNTAINFVIKEYIGIGENVCNTMGQ